MQSKGIAILGSTGSVGRNTLDVVARNRQRFHVVALGARQSVGRLMSQVERFSPAYVVVTDDQAAKVFKRRLQHTGHRPTLLAGAQGLEQVACLPEVDCVMAAIVGGAGLPSTLCAAQAGKTILLANKEALVMAGALLISQVDKHKATLLPVDSEHNAVFQCMHNLASAEIKQGVTEVTLTASGGPFLHTPMAELDAISPEQACHHPNWKMGRKISVDSATMMNKGLEVIEACLLFGLEASKVRIVIHPQSIVHAMVGYQDGSLLAHLGFPDMRVPIAHALAWPQRMTSGVAGLNITQCSKLEFFEPDMRRFPCLKLAMQAIDAGRSLPAVMNAANEVAVQSFLRGRIKFTQIYPVVADVMARLEPVKMNSVETILAVDQQARKVAFDTVSQISQ